jgi:hypothetical protein
VSAGKTAKELLKFAAMRWSPGLLHRHHRAFENPARSYMETAFLPKFGAMAGSKVLFVGCRSYTYHYRDFFMREAIEYWTCDIDPSAKIWGERGKHLVCDMREIDGKAPPSFFDLVMLNGIFGYGIDDAASMNQTIRAIRRILKPHGHLLIGWNNGRVDDPLTLTAVSDLFEHKNGFDLPDRMSFSGHSHVYDLFRARPTAV